MTPEIEIARNWHCALNSGNVDQLVALVHEDVEIGGPRGSAHGRAMMRTWFERANIRMYPTRFFYRDHIVVVEEAAQWHDADTGEKTSSTVVATIFEVHDGLITRLVRHDDLETALQAASLTEADALQME